MTSKQMSAESLMEDKITHTQKTHTRRHIHTKDGVEETHVPMVCEEAERRYAILFIICYLLLTALTFSLKSQ